MSQIFLVLSVGGNLALVVTFLLGFQIEDAGSVAESARHQVSFHFLFALASVTFALLVHAIVLTYFMGTGRWIEETSAAYRLAPAARKENIRLKYQVIPGMMLCMGLLLTTGAFGAIADPASAMDLSWAVTAHFLLAVGTIFANGVVTFLEWQAIRQNRELVDLVYAEVLSIRQERGLDPPTPGE